MMFCDRCDRGYHTYCVGLQAIPDGSWQCSVCDPPAPSSSISPTSPVKGKRGRPPSNSRLSHQQSINHTSKIENVPTRVSSRRSRQPLSTPLSPSNSSSSTDLPPTNSSSMNLILTRHQQQWTTTTTTTTSTPTEIKSKT